MSTEATNAFNRLLNSWRSHDDLRHEGATIAELAASRRSLDMARLEMRRSVAL